MTEYLLNIMYGGEPSVGAKLTFEGKIIIEILPRQIIKDPDMDLFVAILKNWFDAGASFNDDSKSPEAWNTLYNAYKQ